LIFSGNAWLRPTRLQKKACIVHGYGTEVLILLNKPFRVLSQFRDPDGRATLGDFVDLPGVYPAGRLDFDSEGLMLLTDDGRLQARISDPRNKMPKTYWAQVEGVPSTDQLHELERGVRLKDGPATAVSARVIEAPEGLWERDPPIRYRKNVPDSWVEIVLTEGRNRQVRRMTAAVGLPTLRLIRYAVGEWTVDGLRPGEWREVTGPQSA
jgi:23S rRNA pseudouridine2457 synthase